MNESKGSVSHLEQASSINRSKCDLAPTALIHSGVFLGRDSVLMDYVIVGVPPKERLPGEIETYIGANAIIRSHTVIYAGNKIGVNFQTGHDVMIREMNEIGDDVSIGTHSVVEHHVIIRNQVRIHTDVFIPEYSILENGAWVGPSVVFTNAPYPLSPDAKDNLKGPHLMELAKIGANATLLPGVVIGRKALVGAGSVVVQDVPDGKVVVGNPARVIGDVIDLKAYQTEE